MIPSDPQRASATQRQFRSLSSFKSTPLLIFIFGILSLFIQYKSLISGCNANDSEQNLVKRDIDRNPVVAWQGEGSSSTYQNTTSSAAPVAASISTPIWNTSARICDERPVQLDGHWYKSQSGEDRELQKLFFKDLCNGRYLEIGGLDGVRYSNTHMYNKGLNWTGVLVEASPKNYQQLIKNRPNEIANVHAGVCEEEMDLHWVESVRPAVRGFKEFTTSSFQKRWWSEEEIQNAQVVKCRRLEQILDEEVGAGFYFDFFTLDVEGAELSVLQSINFDLVGFGVIVVEADGHNTTKNMAAKSLLESNGYVYMEDKLRSSWFRNEDFEIIYSDIKNGV